MDELSIVLFLALSIWGVVWGLKNKVRIFQLPFLICFSSIAFIGPQSIILLSNPDKVPPNSIWPHFIWISLCLIASFLGFFKAPSSKLKRYRPSRRGLEMICATLTAIAALSFFFIYKAHSSSVDVLAAGGVLAMHYSLVKLSIPAAILTVSLFCFGQCKRTTYLIAVSIVVIFSYFIFALGRRQWVFLAAYSLIFPRFLLGKVKVNRGVLRSLVIASGLFASAVIILLPAYRDKIKDDSLSLSEIVSQEPPRVVLKKYFSGAKDTELERSVIGFKIRLNNGNFAWGSGFWNRFIQFYVPKFLVGESRKSGLMIHNTSEHLYLLRDYGDVYPLRSYISVNGFTDVFCEFGPFGLALYFAIGRIYRRFSNGWLRVKDARSLYFLLFFGFYPMLLVYGSWSVFLMLGLLPFAFYLALLKLGVKEGKLNEKL